MKTLRTTILAGSPIFLDSLRLIQDNVRDLTAKLGKAYQFTSMEMLVIEGCVVSIHNAGGINVTYDLSDGLVYYEDELYIIQPVTGGSLPDGYTQQDFNDNYFFDNLESLTMNVTFKDLSNHNIHSNKYMILTTNPSHIISPLRDYGHRVTLRNQLVDQMPISSETVNGFIELATQYEVNVGTDVKKAVTPKTLRTLVTEDFDIIKRKRVEIGAWNMYASDTGQAIVNIPHGLLFSKITAVNVFILNDNQDSKVPLLTGSGGSGTVNGSINIGTTSIELATYPGGYFDNSDFNDSLPNRGWIIIDYDE